MTAAQTTLKLTDTTAAAPAATPRVPRRANPQAQRFQQLAADWAALDGIAKSSWNQLAQATADALRPKSAPSRDTAYTAYIAANTALLNTGQPVLSSAPAVHAVPPALPPLTLTASYAHTGLSLTLGTLNDNPYTSSPVLVYAARPQLSGRGLYPHTPFTLLGVLPGISTENITALYQSKYRVPSAGYQITLKLSPVSATGYRRPPVTVTGLVTAAPASAPGGPLTLK